VSLPVTVAGYEVRAFDAVESKLAALGINATADIAIVRKQLTLVRSAGYYFGGFTNTTDACASCHRAHSAISSDGMLLVAPDVWSLCISCHDGTGAYTDVVNGNYDNTIPAGDPHGKGTSVGAFKPQGQAGMGTFAGGFINDGFAQFMNRCATHWHFYRFTREAAAGNLRLYNSG
jgi:predicted CXXCH cytochrome family protein